MFVIDKHSSLLHPENYNSKTKNVAQDKLNLFLKILCIKHD
jgi:hypothetical protein